MEEWPLLELMERPRLVLPLRELERANRAYVLAPFHRALFWKEMRRDRRRRWIQGCLAALLVMDVKNFPKGEPARAARAKRRMDRERIDRQETAKAKARSGGRCEGDCGGERCGRAAVEVHHVLGGNGRRARGDSALAANKLHLCRACHRRVHRL